ncbi:MFS transporter [Isoptericola aurantiacus]|uniref:MFS transporter n=1 Tax=Isoptericola aurantiacus TaxID=3377839 RepID=UPI00383B3864
MSATRAEALVRTRRRFVVLTAWRWLPLGLVVPVLVLLLRERGMDLATTGALVAVYSVATLLLELPTGGLADVVGRRPVLAASSVLGVLATALFAVAPSAGLLVVAYVALGVSRALDSGPLQAWYVDAVQAVDPAADLRRGLSRAGVAEALGLGVGSVLSGLLVAVSPFPDDGGVLVALSTPFLVAAALGAVHLVMVLLWVSPVGDRPRATWRSVLADVPSTVVRGARLATRRAVLRRIVLGTAALGVALAGIELLAPTGMAALLGGESRAAATYSVLVAGGFAGTAVGAGLAPWLGRVAGSAPRGVLAVLLLAAVALAVLATPVLGVAATAFVIFYLALGAGGPLLDELTHRAVTSGERATVLSVRSMALQSGGVVASLGVGALVQASTTAVGLGVLAAVLALGASAMVRWPSEREPAVGAVLDTPRHAVEK